MAGFFSAGAYQTGALSQASPLTKGLPRCGACKLCKHSRTPKLPLTGKGQAGIMFVSEYPSKEEDSRGELGSGPVWKALSKLSGECLEGGQQFDLLEDCWLVSALACHPIDGKHVQKDLSERVPHCRPALIAAIEQARPRIIIPLGYLAHAAVIGALTSLSVLNVAQFEGYHIPALLWNCWVAPMRCPARVLEGEEELRRKSGKNGFTGSGPHSPVHGVFFRRHLKKLFATLHPFLPLHPDNVWRKETQNGTNALHYFNRRAKPILEEREAMNYMHRILSYDRGVSAFDYETNCLKPDTPKRDLVSFGICWEGEPAVAFMLTPKLQKMVGVYLRKRTFQKIASNMKFEERWTWAIFGHGVAGWLWDTMLAAKVFHNNSPVTSIKTQSFLLLGTPTYNTGVEAFFHAPDKETARVGTNAINRIREVPIETLLRYNAIDAYVEYYVAFRQMSNFREQVHCDHAEK